MAATARCRATPPKRVPWTRAQVALDLAHPRAHEPEADQLREPACQRLADGGGHDARDLGAGAVREIGARCDRGADASGAARSATR